MSISNLGIAQSSLAWSELGIKQDGGDNDEDGFEQEKKIGRASCRERV